MEAGKKVALGVLAGAAVGAIAGVLLAPDKGSETRKKISKKTSDTVTGVKDKVASVVGTIGSKFQNGKEEVVEKFDIAKDKIADKVSDKVQDLKKA
ncbi:MAG: YtxH domain-containing protein [Crocinitomicaceae bacterium]|nr:YtxH domain-containing protein [Crocinitomicaceae bacterium]